MCPLTILHGIIQNVKLEVITLEKEIIRLYDVLTSCEYLKIIVNLSHYNFNKIDDFIKLGLKDIGSVFLNSFNNNLNVNTEEELISLDQSLSDSELVLHQRFPLTRKFIMQEKYSKKLGQVFDSYKYKIKKYEQEKLKQLRAMQAAQ